MTRRHRRGVAHGRGLLGVVAALVLGGAGCASGTDAGSLPDVELTTLDGTSTIGTDTIAGPAVINLWATWCGPCRTELPAFEAVHVDLAGQVRFVGVNQGDEGGPAAAFLDEVGVTFEQYLDVDGALSDALAITGLPATVLVTEDGTTQLHAGALDQGELLELIDTALGVTP